MGEIFPREFAVIPLDFTGERMTAGHTGQVEFEHLHRYFFAREFCRDKDVLDVAAGEGYGSAYLGQVARSVVGIELSGKTVEHANLSYRRHNLNFYQGDARRLELPDGSFDVVTSFETIEHFFAQEDFLNEVCRVLRPDGKLIISSPDRDVYSFTGSGVNPFHVKELSRQEFGGLLTARFAHCDLYSQRTITGTLLVADPAGPTKNLNWTFERRGGQHFEASRGLPRAPFVVAVASNEPIAVKFDSCYIDTSDVEAGSRALSALQDEHQRQLAGIQSDRAEERGQAMKSTAGLQADHAAQLDRMQALQRLQVETAEARMCELQQERDAALHKAAVADAAARRIETSTIWRWSAPLRQVVNAMNS